MSGRFRVVRFIVLEVLAHLWVMLSAVGFALCVTAVVFTLFMNEANAQVTMDVPFVPIGISGGYLPVVEPAASIPAQATFRGVDENGAEIYATDWVEVPPEEFADALDAEMANPGSSGARRRVNDAGMEVDPRGDDGERIYWEKEPSWLESVTATQCRRRNPPSAGSGFELGDGSPITLAECQELLAGYWGATPVYETAVWQVARDGSGCVIGATMHDDAGGGTPGLIRGFWSGIAEPDLDCVPDPPREPSGWDFLPVFFIDQSNTYNMFTSTPAAAQAAAEAEGPPITPPVMNFDNRTFEDVVINNITYVTSITDKAAELTDAYEASGDVGDLPEGSGPEPPPGVGLGDDPADDFAEGLEDFCRSNPSSLMCQDMGDGSVDSSDVHQAAAEFRAGHSGLVSNLEALLDGLDGFALGDGPDLGMGNPSECPLAGGIPVAGSSLVIDTDPLCDVTGGPLRMVLLIIAWVMAAIVVMRGVAA